jgi:signal transduction histidine kinase
VIVAIIWGIKLLRRWSAHEIAPNLRQRWIEREMDRELASLEARQAARSASPGGRGANGAARQGSHDARSLVRELGEDPASPESVGWAREALRQAERVASAPRRAGPREVALDELIEGALEAVRERRERAGVALHTEFDSRGPLRADPQALRRLLTEALSCALEARERAASGEGKLDVHVGENLAGTRVWVRIRPGPAALDAADLPTLLRPFYRESNDAGEPEFLLEFDKHGASHEPREASPRTSPDEPDA